MRPLNEVKNGKESLKSYRKVPVDNINACKRTKKNLIKSTI